MPRLSAKGIIGIPGLKKIERGLSETLHISARFAMADNSAVVAQAELTTLIKECLAQSRSAQKRLFDKYAPAAYGTIKRYIGKNEGLAQEILNDSFLKVLTKLDQYHFQGPFEGWIRRIVVNTLTDTMRKNINQNQNITEIQPEDYYMNSDSVDRIAHKELLHTVQELPDTQRTVFNLFAFENYSHREIGNMLGITENNSRWYLNDARKRLKEKLNFIIGK